MTRLEDVVDPAKQTARLVPAYAAEDGQVSIGGLLQPALWLQHIYAEPGDPIKVLMVEYATTPAHIVVLGQVGQNDGGTSQPRDGVVSVAPLGSDTVTVTTSAGDVEATTLASYTPVISDRVRLLWQGREATILGKVGATPARPAPPKKPSTVPRPPGKKAQGAEVFTASNSGTWTNSTKSWNSYFGKHVYQGSYGNATGNRGAWFYHGKPGKLDGKTITRVQIWVPRRLKAGSWNAAVTLNFFLHSSKRKPSRDVDRGAGTTNKIPASWKGGWVELPATWGKHITGGSGVGLSGGSYAGFPGVSGKGSDARSGQIRMEWKD